MSRQWIFVLETSVTNASLVLACDGEIKARSNFTSERSQEVDLFPPLQEILATLPSDERLSTIVIGTGPGSYNGARVGIAAAQAIAQTHGCRVAGLCSFEGVTQLQSAPKSWAVGDARRGSFFLMELRDGKISSAPELLEHTEFLSRLSSCEGPIATFENPERLNLPEGHSVIEATSSAEALLASWLSRGPAEKEALLNIPPEAFYLRPPHITKAKPKSLS
ncbi:tRNA (adenosine(37)-N6)-threonylcarbamoyltransferase complex dimerization subunit type 1 TsaB [Akkermansiaceae bacterium]|nr:tRNA (adenosine(37)-N6)-threonylcarbamoyltransferase complex dimerization subunit type 1 TsaB [Akkermansiaceae bacterium]MDB4537923.1 tRNA (adenosine(37)-N6)-threonylcarbamoyltransferase complex dimerization subunit type 1 TsaB [Akkermansiaceae bacterium]